MFLTATLFCTASENEWKFSPVAHDDFFPIGVWLQNPGKADQYKQAGFNLYVGLWKGPTEEQLSTLRQHDMRLLCHQNKVALSHKDDPLIAGWLQMDEPDNAQEVRDPATGQRSYGPPVDPQEIIRRYESMKAEDSSRPVLLNLGQGVANDEWVGHGSGFNKDSYFDYAKGCDILSYDIYPVTGLEPDGVERIWYVAKGVDRLRQWGGEKKILWNFVECAGHKDKKATPEQVKAEVWMSLVHGSTGILYFVHQFEPAFNESALLSDPEMLAAVTKINKQVQEMAPVLNTPSQDNAIGVETSDPESPVDCMVKEYQDLLYIFAVGMRNREATATFSIPGLDSRHKVEDLQEPREIKIVNTTFRDRFKPYEVKMYRVKRMAE